MTKALAAMTADEFAASANVSRETLARLENYAALLEKWQESINLVGGDSLKDIWRRHMLDSAQLAAHIPPTADVITDLGSGAGFPGLVLSIMLDHPIHLIEASGKKTAFLREAVRLTSAPALIHHDRIEKLEPWASDVVLARALAPLTILLDYAEPFLREAGDKATCIFLKGGRAAEELTEASKSWNMSSERFQSVSDPTGVILRIRDIVRDGHSG
jgi:16S rRNA (guanine527-N7)-methyltransferase